MFRALPEPDKLEVFFKYWTCKEAYIKARGEGLSLPLDQFQVVPVAGQAAPLLVVEGDSHKASRWYLRELTPGPGYVAALAAEGEDWSLEQWHFSELAATEIS